MLNDVTINSEVGIENPNLSKYETLNDSKWVGKAQDHLYQHMQMFVGLAVHPQNMIKEGLFGLCRDLQKKSWKALQNTRPLQVRVE